MSLSEQTLWETTTERKVVPI